MFFKLVRERLAEQVGGQVIQGESVIGGGSTPAQTLPSWLVALPGDAVALEHALRRGKPPVVARIETDRVVIDLRTVGCDEDQLLLEVIQRAI